MNTPNKPVYNKSQAQAELDSLVKSARDAVKDAQKHADEHGLNFDFSIAQGELAATYYGKKFIKDGELAELWDIKSQEEWDDRRDENDEFIDGWYSSYFGR